MSKPTSVCICFRQYLHQSQLKNFWAIMGPIWKMMRLPKLHLYLNCFEWLWWTWNEIFREIPWKCKDKIKAKPYPSFNGELEVIDWPSGGGRGPEGTEKEGIFSRLSSRRGNPNPALAQLTSDNSPLNASATGETKLSVRNFRNDYFRAFRAKKIVNYFRWDVKTVRQAHRGGRWTWKLLN